MSWSRVRPTACSRVETLQLAVDVAGVGLQGAVGDEQLAGDLLERELAIEPPEDFPLSLAQGLGEPAVRARLAAPVRGVSTGSVLVTSSLRTPGSAQAAMISWAAHSRA